MGHTLNYGLGEILNYIIIGFITMVLQDIYKTKNYTAFQKQLF